MTIPTVAMVLAPVPKPVNESEADENPPVEIVVRAWTTLCRVPMPLSA